MPGARSSFRPDAYASTIALRTYTVKSCTGSWPSSPGSGSGAFRNSEMQDFIYFLGRIHVLVLHLPIALILVAVLLDWVVRRERYRQLAVAAPFLWGGAALSAVVTVALGYMHLAEGVFTGPVAGAHRFFGTTLAVFTVLLWWLCSRR